MHEVDFVSTVVVVRVGAHNFWLGWGGGGGGRGEENL